MSSRRRHVRSQQGDCKRRETEWGVDAQFRGVALSESCRKGGGTGLRLIVFDPMMTSKSQSDYAASKAHLPSDGFGEMQSLHSKSLMRV